MVEAAEDLEPVKEIRILLSDGMKLTNRLKMMERFEFYCPMRDDDLRLVPSEME